MKEQLNNFDHQNVNDQARRRFVAALNHKESDRVPLTLGSPSCSLHKNAHEKLLKHLNFPRNEQPPITDNILQIVETDERLINYFDIDVLWLLPLEAPVNWSDGKNNYIDEFGRRFISGGGFFNQIDHPLKEGTPQELKRYQFPNVTHAHRYEHLYTQGEKYFNDGYGLGVDGPWGIYEISSSLRGVAEYFMDLAANPTYAEEIAERVLEEHHIPFYSHLLKETAPFVQMVGISDDLGSQKGLLFSPKTFQKIFKPRLRRLIDHIRSLADVKIYMHSDGSIFPIIPDLIEIGVDGLNPVQYTAKGMELNRLKKEFGKDLGFLGGVIENNTLSFSTPQEVKTLVMENMSILAPDGGFIFAPIHNISPEVPPENIIALYQSGRKYGKD